MSGTQKLRIDEIEVGERRREEFGDIAALARSIAKYGLLHPIVVSGNLLVAGERRLRAMQHLGYDQIDARDWGDLDERTRREIELEENTRRKDLTPFECSKNLEERAEIVAERQIAAVETLGATPRVSGGKRGPASQPGSDKQVARELGVDPATLRHARAHVAAAEEFPVLAAPTVTQEAAIKTATNLRALPEPVREEVLKQPTAAAVIDAVTRAIEEQPDVQVARLRKQWMREVVHIQEQVLHLDPDTLVSVMNDPIREATVSLISDLRRWLDQVEQRVHQRGGLRLVGGAS